MKDWFVYILKCVDETFYTGVTQNVDVRLHVHNTGKGAKYTKGRLPVELIYFKKIGNRGAALKEEVRIKKLTRRQKRELVDQFDREVIR